MSEDTRPTPYSQEIASLTVALSKVIRPEFVPVWLSTPNEELDGLSPRAAIERSERSKVWRVVFLMGSGLPL